MDMGAIIAHGHAASRDFGHNPKVQEVYSKRTNIADHETTADPELGSSRTKLKQQRK